VWYLWAAVVIKVFLSLTGIYDAGWNFFFLIGGFLVYHHFMTEMSELKERIRVIERNVTFR